MAGITRFTGTAFNFTRTAIRAYPQYEGGGATGAWYEPTLSVFNGTSWVALNDGSPQAIIDTKVQKYHTVTGGPEILAPDTTDPNFYYSTNWTGHMTGGAPYVRCWIRGVNSATGVEFYWSDYGTTPVDVNGNWTFEYNPEILGRRDPVNLLAVAVVDASATGMPYRATYR